MLTKFKRALGWLVPGTRSAAKILGLILTLIGFISVAQAQPDYAPALWAQAYQGHWYTSGNGHSFCVIHDMEGYYESVISYFQQPYQGATNNFADAHFCVNSLQNGNDPAHNYSEHNPGDALPGEITQMVREQYYAWHVRCWNTYTFGTEHEGFVDSPAWYSEAMYQASAGLQHHLCVNYGITMDRNHIIGHNEWQNSTWVAWVNALPPGAPGFGMDPTCNTHSDPGQYWNWSHFIDLVIGTNTGAVLATDLKNRAVDQGSNFSFTVTSTGTLPLRYYWFLNGTNLPNYSSATFSIPNIQPSNAGTYFVIASNAFGTNMSSKVNVTVNPTQTWVVVFSDNLDANSSANWQLFQASSDNVSDYTTNWAFDYSAVTYSFNSVTQTIPVAPHTTNTARIGLKLTVNKNNASAAASGVSLYPKNLTFSNNYALRFDMWMNYNGVSGGGSGSTEYATFGINHTGTRINWGAGTALASDGLWFAATGEGGASSDYLAFAGNPSGNPTQLSFANGGFAVNGAASLDSADTFFQTLFPSPTYETPGSPGKHWVQGEVSQINNVITWKCNGVVVAERTNTSAFTSGDVMIGYMDTFPSLASPAADCYIIFDNVQVLTAGTAPSISAQPQNFAVLQNGGTNATFSVTATGFPAPTYQWQFNTTNIPLATNSSYTLVNPQSTNAGNYSVVVSNAVTSISSSNAVLTVYSSPGITTPPVNRTVNQNQTTVFSVVASGLPAPTYQWQLNSNNIPNATNANYFIPSAQTNQAGSYVVILSNNFGSFTSVPVTLTVNFAPIITSQPHDVSTTIGSNATFTVTAIGVPIPAYQWLYKGVAINGATSSNYTILNARTTNAGNYSVIITNLGLNNLANSVTSSNALLSVVAPPPQFQQISLGADGVFQMFINGPPGCVYAVDISSNLVDWTPLTTFTNVTGSYQFINQPPSGNTNGFYRVTLLSD